MSHDAHAHDGHHHHVTPLPVYVGVFVALLFLTGLTVWIAQFDLGVFTTPIAMLVATVKATLVCAFFMHLLFDDKLNAIVFSFGLIFVSLFFLFVFADVMTRDFIDPVRGNHYQWNQELRALEMEVEKKENKTAPGIEKRFDIAAPDEASWQPPPPPPPPPPPAPIPAPVLGPEGQPVPPAGGTVPIGDAVPVPAPGAAPAPAGK